MKTKLERMGSFSKVVEPDCEIIYEAWIEKRGELNKSFKKRYAVLFETCELFYYDADEDAMDHKTVKGVVNLVNVQEIRPNDDKGKFAYGWEIQQKKRTYRITSGTEEERDLWLKLIQDVRDTIVFQQIDLEFKQQHNKKGKSKKKHTYESKHDANNVSLRKHHKPKTNSILFSFLTQSNTEIAGRSIDGGMFSDEEDEKQIIKYVPIYKDEVEKYSRLEMISLSSLNNIATLRIKNGCFGYQYMNTFEKKTQDLIISNEFLQIGVGSSLVIDEHIDEKEHIDNRLKADIMHSGELRTKVDFIPNTDSFSICCYIYLMKYNAGNRIISNKYGSKQRTQGFEFMVSPQGKVSAFLCGYGMHQFIEIGSNALDLYRWYYVTIIVKKTNDVTEGDNDHKEGPEETTPTKLQKDSIATDIYVYLNGKLDGKLSFGKVTNFNVNKTDHRCVVGSSIELRLTKSLCGKIYNLNIFRKRALMEEEITTLFATEAKPDQSITFSYIPSTLRLLTPHCVWKYNGKLYQPLPEYHHIEPRINDSFTITAWVTCTKLCTDYLGSVIVSNLKSINSNQIIQKQGFEILYPSKDSHVLSVVFTAMHSARFGSRSLSVAIGSTKCVLNKPHSIAVSVDRLEDGNTLITAYINGKQDGVFQTKSMDLCGKYYSFFGRNGDKHNQGLFHGCIQNMRYFDRTLTEGEIACIYVCDQKERCFKQNQTVLYSNYSTNQTPNGMNENQAISPSTKGVISRCNYNDCDVFLEDPLNEDEEIRVNLSEIEVLHQDVITSIDLNTLKEHQNMKEIADNLGGMICGTDWKGNEFKVFVAHGAVLQHLVSVSCLTLLQNMEPFAKDDIQRLIDSKHIKNKVVVNRLLSTAHILLRDINSDKHNWDYLHQHILGLDEIWSDCNNFGKLKAIAKSFQSQFAQEQFDLFDELKAQKDWKMFNVENDDYKHESIQCRQDAFHGGLLCELDDTLVSNEISTEYDQKVATMMIWGRNYIINTQFHKTIAALYHNDERFEFHAGELKKYERVVEKTVQYQAQDSVKYPAAFEMCDISRCSVTCYDLDAVYDALQILKENVTIVQIENRFSMQFDPVLTDGYRDMMVNVLFEDQQTNLKSICEVQFHLNDFLVIKKNLHKYDKIARSANCELLLKEYENERN